MMKTVSRLNQERQFAMDKPPAVFKRIIKPPGESPLLRSRDHLSRSFRAATLNHKPRNNPVKG